MRDLIFIGLLVLTLSVFLHVFLIYFNLFFKFYFFHNFTVPLTFLISNQLEIDQMLVGSQLKILTRNLKLIRLDLINQPKFHLSKLALIQKIWHEIHLYYTPILYEIWKYTLHLNYTFIKLEVFNTSISNCTYIQEHAFTNTFLKKSKLIIYRRNCVVVFLINCFTFYILFLVWKTEGTKYSAQLTLTTWYLFTCIIL